MIFNFITQTTTTIYQECCDIVKTILFGLIICVFMFIYGMVESSNLESRRKRNKRYVSSKKNTKLGSSKKETELDNKKILTEITTNECVVEKKKNSISELKFETANDVKCQNYNKKEIQIKRKIICEVKEKKIEQNRNVWPKSCQSKSIMAIRNLYVSEHWRESKYIKYTLMYDLITGSWAVKTEIVSKSSRIHGAINVVSPNQIELEIQKFFEYYK